MKQGNTADILVHDLPSKTYFVVDATGDIFDTEQEAMKEEVKYKSFYTKEVSPPFYITRQENHTIQISRSNSSPESLNASNGFPDFSECDNYQSAFVVAQEWAAIWGRILQETISIEHDLFEG